MRLNTKKILEMFKIFEETIESRKNGWVSSVYLRGSYGGGLHIYKNNRLFYDIRYDGLDTHKYYLNDSERVIFEPQTDLNVILSEVVRLADEHDKWESNANEDEIKLFYNPITEVDLWKETLKNKEWNTITLKGIRETEVFVINDHVFNFVIGIAQTPQEKSDALNTIWNTMEKDEQFEYTSKKSFIKKMNSISRDNDRAVHLRGERFWSEKEAIDFFKKNKIKIKQEYSGYLY